MMDTTHKKQDPELDNIRSDWDTLNIDDIVDSEKRLSDALDNAVKSGADKETMFGILNEWKDYHDKALDLQAQLALDGRTDGRPDAMKDFADKSVENAEKGMHILGGKVNEFVDQKFTGNGLTARILAAHEKVSTVFHEKQEELSKSLKKGLDNLKLNIGNLADMARLNRWVKAVDAAERFESTHDERVDGINTRKGQSIDKIDKSMHEKMEKNRAAFDKVTLQVGNGTPTKSDRIMGGFNTILDAGKGAEFKDYFTKEALDEKAGKNLKEAKEALDKADKKTVGIAGLKLNVVKAWANFQLGTEKVLGKLAADRAERATKAVENIKSPNVKDLQQKIANARNEAGGTLKDAKTSIQKDMKESEKSNISKDGLGDR